MRSIPLLVLLVLCTPALGQTAGKAPADSAAHHREIKVDASLTTRWEFRDGGMTTYDDDMVSLPASFFYSRTRINAHYSQDWLTVHISPQHQNIWGQTGGGNFSLYEGWARFDTHFGLFFKVGRQELAYDDQRIIGADDWTMLASCHDVVKAGFESRHHSVHGIFAFNQNEVKISGGTWYEDGGEPYKFMETLWYHYDANPVPLSASLLFMNIGMQSGTPTDYHTENQQLLGTFVKFNPQKFSVEASYYRQMGHEENGMQIDAWMASAKLQYKPSDRWTLTGGYDYMSGDEDFILPEQGQIGLIQKTKVRGFSPLFGAHHKFYGAMDFFYVQTYYGCFTPGLQNAYAGVQYSPVPDVLSISANYHYLAVAVPLNNAAPTLGHEAEVSASWQFHKFASLQAGYTGLFGADTMTKLKRGNGSKNLHWIWVGMSVTPTFLNAKL